MAIEKRERSCWEIVNRDGSIHFHAPTHSAAWAVLRDLNLEHEPDWAKPISFEVPAHHIAEFEGDCFRASCDEPDCTSEACSPTAALPAALAISGGWSQRSDVEIYCPDHNPHKPGPELTLVDACLSAEAAAGYELKLESGPWPVMNFVHRLAVGGPMHGSRWRLEEGQTVMWMADGSGSTHLYTRRRISTPAGACEVLAQVGRKDRDVLQDLGTLALHALFGADVPDVRSLEKLSPEDFGR